MAIPWNNTQLSKVKSALNTYHINTDKCAAAARRILPVAKQVHRGARGIQLTPLDAAPFLLTVNGRRKFYHHVVVEVVSHRVDALTGPHGHEIRSYLATFFQYPDGIGEEPVDVESIDPGIQWDD